MDHKADPFPRCILLNGTSSSGKTSLAKALQERLQVVFLNFSIDSILYTLPPSDLAAMMQGTPIARGEYQYDRLVDGFHAAIAGLLTSGNRLIVDNALTRIEWKAGFDTAVTGHRTFRIGVTCDPTEAKRRERSRGDRAIGTVDYELPRVHEGMAYDLVVDTTWMTTAAIADEVIRMIAARA
jgi:chloramphenicol 3-O phosphotransferase